MDLLFKKEFFCPYCGSGNNINLDSSEGKQYQLVVDCEVCCRPITIRVKMIEDEWQVDVRRENE